MIIVPFLVFSLLLLIGYYRKRRLLTAGNFVAFIWAGSTGLSIFTNYYAQGEILPEATLFLTFNITLCLLPWVLVDISGPPVKMRTDALVKIEMAVIAAGLLASIYYVPGVIRTFLSGFGHYRELVNEGVIQMSRLGLVFNVLSGVWLLALVLAAVSYSQRSRSLRTFLLLGASGAYLMCGLSFAGRSGVVYWAMAATFISLTYIRPSQAYFRTHARILLLALAIILVTLGFLFYGAYSRDIGGSGLYEDFKSADRSSGAAYSLLGYWGDSSIKFNQYWAIRWDDTLIYGGGRNLPLVFTIGRWIRLTPSYDFNEITEDAMSRYNDLGQNSEVFATFLRELIYDFGVWGACLVSLGLSLVSWASLKRYARTRSVADYLLVVFLASILMFGIFFSSVGTFSGNGILFTILGAYLYLRLSSPRAMIARSKVISR